MSSRAKILLGVVMTLSLLFGFLHEIWPDAALSFKRLHIFGFNLLTGGSLILYHIVGKGVFTPRLMAYFAFALLYALFAAAGWYIPALLLSIPLFLLVENSCNKSGIGTSSMRPDMGLEERALRAATCSIMERTSASL